MKSFPGTSSTFTTTRRRERPEDNTLFGYESPPDLPTMNRDVYKWVQSLDLSHSLVNVRRDAANGFIVAAIFNRYYPADIKMHGFENATSSHFKRDNWQQLQLFCEKQGLALPKDLVDGTMNGVHGAAAALIEHLYETLTGKKVQRLPLPVPSDTSVPGPVPINFGTATGGGNTEGGGNRTISSGPRASQNIEFGAVQTSAAGDAIALRRKLAAGGL